MSHETPQHEIREALEQLIAGKATSNDEELLRDTLQNSQYAIAVGEHAVAISGNANDAIIITGDGNVVHVFNGLDTNALDTIARLVRESQLLRTLLTPEQFFQRAEREALVRHKGILVGRGSLFERMREQLARDIQVLVLYGSGGIGKTRVLLSLPDCVPPGAKVWFLRTEAESVEDALAALDRENHLVLVIDDAHRFTPLPHIHEVLVNPDFAGRITIILTTRPVFKDMVISQLSPLQGDHLSFIQVDSLTNADIDQLLQQQPNTIVNDSIRHALVRIADGNPLIASIAARLVHRGAQMIELTRDEVLTHYLDDIIQDLARVHGEHYEDYISYLDILAALGSLEMHNQDLIVQVHQVVGLSPQTGERILAKLQTTGLVVRYGTVLTIASEVLADHILFRHFFDPQTKQVDYLQFIIKPFIAFKPKDILKRLAAAEIKGDSLEAGVLLGDLLDLYTQAIKTEGNAGKLQALTLLQDIAYFRSDDILAIVVNIIENPVLAPESIHYPGWGNFEISYEMVLNQVIDLLGETIYGLSLDDTITCLHKLATYRPDEQAYMAVRDKAKHALSGIAAFIPGKPYAVQLALLKHIAHWIEQDFVGNLDVIIALMSPMLSMLWEANEDDPTKPSTITLKWGVLGKDDLLQRIRQQALDLLYKMYRLSTHLIERVHIVQALGGAVPYARPDIEVPPEIKAWLFPDCIKTARFLSEMVIPNAELPVLDAVASWLSHATSVGGYEGEELIQIRQQLYGHRLYQLFRLLISRFRYDDEDDRLDWQANEQRRRREIEEYVQRLSDATITQVIHDLSLIVEQVHEAKRDSETYWLDFLLQKLGEHHPDFGDRLIKQALTNGLAFKDHLHWILIGLRRSSSDAVSTYISSWVASDDEALLRIIALSYHYVEWGKLQKHEWDILCSLVHKGLSQLDMDVLSLFPSFAPYRPELAVSFLKEIAVRGHVAILRRIADVLAQPNITNDGWDIKIANRQNYLDIFQNFERLPELDHAVERCLNRLGQFEPMLVVDFLERRILNAAEHQLKAKHYHAIPLGFSTPLESIRSSPTYREVLQRVRDWSLDKESALYRNASQVLKIIAGHMDEMLCNILMEWVISDVVQKQKAIAHILFMFNDGQAFYDLSREIITRTDDESVLRAIGGAIASTPLSNLLMASPAYFHRKRIEDLSPWLQDSHFRVRHFAKKEIHYFQKMLENDEGANSHRDWS